MKRLHLLILLFIPLLATAQNTQTTQTGEKTEKSLLAQGKAGTADVTALEDIIENYLAEKGRRMAAESGGKKIWRLYDRRGTVPLTVGNLLRVMDECGVKQPLWVLAQALHETGFFSSNVCRNYNNLFGLYDSSAHDYYRFLRWEDSVVGYVRFIQYRYHGGDYLSFLRHIRYAEDPQYTRRVRVMALRLKDILATAPTT